jgi:hypothetical protein
MDAFSLKQNWEQLKKGLETSHQSFLLVTFPPFLQSIRMLPVGARSMPDS